MENLKNVAPIEDFNWDAYENGESVASASPVSYTHLRAHETGT